MDGGVRDRGPLRTASRSYATSSCGSRRPASLVFRPRFTLSPIDRDELAVAAARRLFTSSRGETTEICETQARAAADRRTYSRSGRWIAEAPGNDRVRGYHLSRLYSPLANLRQMIYESEAMSPSEVQEFQNSVLGETFVPPGGSLSLDVLDRCRRGYDMPEGSKEMTFMGVDVGTKLYTVIRRHLGETGDASRALLIGELKDFTELAALGQRFKVRSCVIDA